MTRMANAKPGPQPFNSEAVLQAVIGTPRQAVRASYLQQAFAVAQGHVTTLIREQHFTLIKRPAQSRGPNASPLLSYDSVKVFLEKRRCI